MVPGDYYVAGVRPTGFFGLGCTRSLLSAFPPSPSPLPLVAALLSTAASFPLRTLPLVLTHGPRYEFMRDARKFRKRYIRAECRVYVLALEDTRTFDDNLRRR